MTRGFVYIVTNQHRSVFYTGVTNNLVRRIFEHKTKQYPDCFTAKYNVKRLVYYEVFDNFSDAIIREKAIKRLSRNSKKKLIRGMNPNWDDLIEKM